MPDAGPAAWTGSARELPADLIDKAAALSKVPANRIGILSGGVLIALQEAHLGGPNWRRRHFDPNYLITHLDYLNGLVDAICHHIDATPEPLLEMFRLFDGRPPSFRVGPGFSDYREKFARCGERAGALREALASTRVAKPSHRPRMSPWDCPAEQFVAMSYGAALRAGGKLTMNTNGAGPRLYPHGTLPAFLELFAPYLPEGMNLPSSKGALLRIKKFIDGKCAHAIDLPC